jgi:phosphoglycerol transferase MdoB-like AlkP superfamily enzyme
MGSERNQLGNNSNQEALGNGNLESEDTKVNQLSREETKEISTSTDNMDSKPGMGSALDQSGDQKEGLKQGSKLSTRITEAGRKLNMLNKKAANGLGKLSARMDIEPKSSFTGPLLFGIGLMVYLELVFHLLVYGSIDGKLIYPVLFAMPVGLLFTLLPGFFDRNVQKALLWLMTGFTCIIFGLQLIYFDIFKVFFSFQSIGMAGDAMNEFGSEILTAILTNLGGLALVFLPLPVLAVLIHKIFSCERRNYRVQGGLFAAAVFLQIFALISLQLFGKGDYSPYDLYHHTKVPDLCGKELGVVTLTRFDLGKLIKGDEELVLADTNAISWDVLQPTMAPTSTPIPDPKVTVTPAQLLPNATPTPAPPPTPTPIDTSPNIMNIDFAALAAAEKDETIRTLHNYFASVTPTNKNAYTGMFEGYNLIQITAEGFYPYAVRQDVTPTLYRLTHEGFIFNNFYTALWQTSTSDGEYVNLTGLIPMGTRSMYHSRNNLLPFTLGHQFDLLGVESKAYHDHTYTYYQRNETHPNLGYLFKAKGNGLVLESDVWPGSDLEMINHTVDEFTDENPFHVYYLTVSGHMNYTFVGNSMSYKNRDLVKDLPLSEDCQAYIACQIELDRAFEQLIKKLEEAGVADRTVIALSADHYPYAWEKEKLDEMAGHEVDPVFEVYKNNFILWNPAMKENIVVDEPCSSLDILPTLSNLFGLTYDSRLLMGRDIFSDAEPLVVLSNRSFITDKVMYNSETGEAINLTGEELPEDYIKNLNKVIKNKFMVSQSILKEDYYRYLFPDYPKDFK